MADRENVSVLAHLLALRDADAKAVANALVGTERALSKAADLADARYEEIGELRDRIQAIAKGLIETDGALDKNEGQTIAARASMAFVFQVITSLANFAAIIGLIIVLLRGS